MGLQGSRARGEAGAESDIDTVLIIDELSASDLARLRQAVAALPERDKLCGFVSGKEELRSWERSELFQFYNDTRPIFGSLDFLLPLLDREAALRSARTGACAMYHGCAHLLLHGGGQAELRELRKAAFFALRALAWLETGSFPGSRAELDVSSRALLESGPEDLLAWASGVIKNVF